MKVHTFALLLAATSSPAFGVTVAYWQLDESNGNLVDVVGGNNFTAGSGYAHSQSALVGTVPNPDATAGAANTSSIDFSTTTGAALLTGASNDPFELLFTRSFTFEGWIQHNISDGSQSGIEQFAGDRHQSSYTGWAAWVNGGKLQVYFDMGAPNVSIQGTTDLDDGNAHHFAIIWDHSNLEFSLYVDGNQEGSMTGDTGDLSNPSNYNLSDDPFALGARSTGGGTYNNNPLNGRLDELRFSDQALSSSEFLNAVPEPSAALLSLLGLLILLRRKR